MSNGDDGVESLAKLAQYSISFMTGTSSDSHQPSDLYSNCYNSKSIQGVVLLRGHPADFTTEYPAFLFDEGEARSLKIEKQLFEGQSDFQHVQVFQVGFTQGPKATNFSQDFPCVLHFFSAIYH
jgi:hypothetical protein